MSDSCNTNNETTTQVAAGDCSTSVERPYFPKRAIVTAGMPYGNKGLHFGHIAGVFVPADVYARFLRDRIGADNVLFVSGTDCYGSPIDEGYRKLVESGGFDGSIEEYVARNHAAQKAALDAYSISLDIYEGSGMGICKPIHKEVTKRFIEKLYSNGYLEKISTAQFYDPEAEMFLNGRQVEGQCPFPGCKSAHGYADECDLGHQYMPEDLIKPVSTVTGKTPEMRDVSNWYFKLPEFRELLCEYVDHLEASSKVREVVPTTIKEFLSTPIIYIKEELEDEYRAIVDKLPTHGFTPVPKGKASFELEFMSIQDRDVARDILAEAGVRFRTGKTLVPFRITGNIDWGVPAPQLEGEEPHTVWCWPESLWAPISFSTACLQNKGHDPAEAYDWWCSKDAEVYQFIGQDNIYFYGVAQSALWSAVEADGQEPQTLLPDGKLQQTTLVANHHVLFLDKKASSSSAIKPPMAIELLDYYTAEQLRAHFLALGLSMKSVSFKPKPFDPAANPKAGDPALKESALLTNIFNRLARSCLYSAQRASGVVVDNAKTGEKANGAQSYMPLGTIDSDLMQKAHQTILEYERLMYRFELHSIMTLMDGFLRSANSYWNDNKDAEGDQATAVLRNAFYLLRVATVLMHPVAPCGTQKICDYLGFCDDFWSWDFIFESNEYFCDDAEKEACRHAIKTLPPRTDFFEKHPSQYEK